jgi:type IV pilus assembly protein PilN
MARINLLPWREERRKLRNREAQTLFGLTAVAAVLIVFVIIWQYGQMIANQERRNQMLTDEIAKVDEKIKEIEALERTRSKLLARKQIIEQLQASRSMMVHLFDDLVRTIPDGVRLQTIKQAGDLLTLEGFAESNARVSEYMRSLEGSQWMGNPDLAIVEAKGPDKRSRYAFTLRVNLRKPDADGKPSTTPPGGADPTATGTTGAAP